MGVAVLYKIHQSLGKCTHFVEMVQVRVYFVNVKCKLDFCFFDFDRVHQNPFSFWSSRTDIGKWIHLKKIRAFTPSLVWSGRGKRYTTRWWTKHDDNRTKTWEGKREAAAWFDGFRSFAVLRLRLRGRRDRRGGRGDLRGGCDFGGMQRGGVEGSISDDPFLTRVSRCRQKSSKNEGDRN